MMQRCLKRNYKQPIFSLIYILTLAAGSALAQAPFGRLFTTAEQREYVDNLRNQNFVSSDQVLKEEYQKQMSANLTDTSPKVKQAAKDVKLSGYVIRDDGAYTVWVDGKSEISSAKPHVKHGKPNARSQRVSLRLGDKITLVKPGQVWKLQTGEIKEHYQVKPKPTPTPDNSPQVDANSPPPGSPATGDATVAAEKSVALPGNGATLVEQARSINKVYKESRDLPEPKK